MTTQIQTPEQIKNKPFFYKPFFIPPERDVFARRAIRAAELAEQDGGTMQAYLKLLAAVSRAQQAALDECLPQAAVPKKTGETELPAADGETLPPQFSGCLKTIAAQVSRDIPPAAQAALDALLALPDEAIRAAACRLLRGETHENEQAYRIWLAAAIQTAWTAWTVQLVDEDVPEREARVHCPCCGSEAVSNVVLSGGDWDGLRYQHCAVCNSRWNALRAKCTFCGDQSAISHERIDTDAPPVFKGARAEHCGKCGHYRKLFMLADQPHADPVADDLASLALDMLVAEEGSERGGYNLFLAA